MYGFNNKDVAVRLRDLVLSGKLNRIARSSVMPAVARKQFNRTYMAMPTSEISAAVGGTAGTDFEVGYGTVKLLRLEVSTKRLLQHTPTRWREITVYNPYNIAIPSSTTRVIQVIKDRHGKYWVGSDPAHLYKQYCRFTLGAALATTDASKSATITDQYGPGWDHSTTSITAYNLLTHTAGTYTFSGASGHAGYAFWDTGSNWRIDQMECPTT